MESRRRLILRQILGIMAQNQIRLRLLHERLDHLVTTHPALIVSHEPPLRDRALVVFLDMIHVGREDPRPAVSQLELQDAEPRGVARRMSDVQAGQQLKKVADHGLPIQVESEVVREVGSCQADICQGEALRCLMSEEEAV